MTTLLSNATIVDGLGGAPFPGSVLVDGTTIKAVIPAGQTTPPADEVLDLDGLTVAPGFIDMHSHSDWLVPGAAAGLMSNFLEQGVTTIIGGNCGISPAPAPIGAGPKLDAMASILLDAPLDYGWESMSGLFDHIDAAKPLVNVANLVGHATIRIAGSNTKRGPMPKAELDRCLAITEEALAEGACGVSFGLGYDPGMYSPLEELEAVARVAARAGKPITVHLKAYSWISPCYPLWTPEAHNVKALREMLELAERAQVALQISHFISVGRRTWRNSQRCLEMVDEARSRGVDVMIDAFAHTCGNTTINALLPFWFLAGLPDAYHSRRMMWRLAAELNVGFKLVGFGPGDLQIMDAGREDLRHLDGLRMDEVARRWGVSPTRAMAKLSVETDGAALVLLHTYSGEPGNEEVLDRVLTHPACLYETDAILRTTGHPNPGGVGTFPRILGEHVRDRGLLALPEAVARMTSQSADRFGISDRGRLAPGQAADIVVFDPTTIAEKPGVGAEPAERPDGIVHVFVNGEQVVDHGVCDATRRPGRAIRVT